MSKTLGSILKVASIAGLAAITGGVALGVAGGFSVGAAFSGVAGVLGVSTSTLAIATAATALRVFGGAESAPKAETSEQALKTERPPRFSAYGRVKLFGAYILYVTVDGKAIDVWAFHDGRIDAIEGWYLGDKKVTRQANGLVQKGDAGIYGGNVIKIGANLGAATETVHADVMAAAPAIWTAAHRGDGVVTGYMISNPVKTKDFQTVYPSGGPNATPLALVMRAQPVFDWRDPAQSVTDPLSWKWSENAVLHLAHYQLVRNNKTWARHFAPTLTYWTAAANDADVTVPLKAGGTEPRYRSCVSHRHAGDGSEHKAVIAAILGCFDGWMAPRQDGALVVYSGRYYTPTVTIGPDVVMSYTVEDGIEDENALNELGVTYVSADHDFNTVDTDPWTNETDILERGAVRSSDLANQVPSASQARRLAKRKMIQAMAPKRGTVVTLPGGETMLSERFIHLTLAEGLGTENEFVAFDGPAEITQLSRNLQTGAVSASWIQADPNIDAWDPAMEQGAGAPVPAVVVPSALVAPVITGATANFGTDSGAGAPGAYLRLIVTGPNRADVVWYARTRVKDSGSDWGTREYDDVAPAASVTIDTEFVPTDAMIEAQVQYQVGDGRFSDWSASAVVDTTTAAIETDYDGGNAMGKAS